MVIYKQHVQGKLAEQQACEFLQKQGMQLIQRNYRCQYGEIDLIMQDQTEIVFVEVRSRTHTNYGSALESIHYHKIQKITRTANHFLQSKHWFDKKFTRFDVIAIQPLARNNPLEWIKNAFMGEE